MIIEECYKIVHGGNYRRAHRVSILVYADKIQIKVSGNNFQQRLWNLSLQYES